MTKHSASIYKEGKWVWDCLQHEGWSGCHIKKGTSRQGKHNPMEQDAQKIIKFTYRNGKDISLSTEYGLNDDERIRTTCKPFIAAGGTDWDKQATHINEQMRHCLYKSLTKETDQCTSSFLLQEYEIVDDREPKVLVPIMNEAIVKLTMLNRNVTITAVRIKLCKLIL